MAQEFSFDITCGFDNQEFVNSLDQTRREMSNRFDFKGVLANIELVNDQKELVIHTESEAKVNSILDILESKLVKRNVPLSVLDKSLSLEDATGGTVRKKIKLKDTLTSEQAKELAKLIRDNVPKVKPIIQGETIRVTSKSKDDLQDVIRLTKEKKSDLPLQFTNYR